MSCTVQCVFIIISNARTLCLAWLYAGPNLNAAPLTPAVAGLRDGQDRRAAKTGLTGTNPASLRGRAEDLPSWREDDLPL